MIDQRLMTDSGSERPIGKCVLVLAAGEARRFDYFPKQLLEFEGKTLIRRAVESALGSPAEVVCVVLGANADRIKAEIDDLPVLIVVNENWSGGMGSSIRCGLETLLEKVPQLESVAITLADQPLIGSEILERLFAASEESGISAAEYAGTFGVPAVFARNFLDELLTLEPSQGAKQVIKEHIRETTLINLLGAGTDIDTPDDFRSLNSPSS